MLPVCCGNARRHQRITHTHAHTNKHMLVCVLIQCTPAVRRAPCCPCAVATHVCTNVLHTHAHAHRYTQTNTRSCACSFTAHLLRGGTMLPVCCGNTRRHQRITHTHRYTQTNSRSCACSFTAHLLCGGHHAARVLWQRTRPSYHRSSRCLSNSCLPCG